MSLVKLLHAADLHIDSPMRGLIRYDGAPVDQMRGATRTAVENLVDLALAENVTAVLLAGDVYDGTWRDFSTGLFFTNQMARLRAADIPVFMISGNHDAENKMTRELPLPDNVHRFDSDKAQTALREDLGLAVHGQSFATGSVKDDLARDYPLPHSDLFNVGILHTSLTGRPGHDHYAPCSVDQLAHHGYEYWALGHVHKRAIEYSDGAHVVFPGNTQGRDAGETGAKGCTLVSVDNLRVVGEPEHRDLDTSARWHEIRVDLSDAKDLDDACDLVEDQLVTEVVTPSAPDRSNAVRVVATGRSAAHAALVGRRDEFVNGVRSLAQMRAGTWIEKVQVQTTPQESRVAPERVSSVVAGLHVEATALRSDPDRVRELLARTRLPSRLPADLRRLLDDTERTDRLTREATDLLTAMVEGRS